MKASTKDGEGKGEEEEKKGRKLRHWDSRFLSFHVSSFLIKKSLVDLKIKYYLNLNLMFSGKIFLWVFIDNSC